MELLPWGMVTSEVTGAAGTLFSVPLAFICGEPSSGICLLKTLKLFLAGGKFAFAGHLYNTIKIPLFTTVPPTLYCEGRSCFLPEDQRRSLQCVFLLF